MSTQTQQSEADRKAHAEASYVRPSAIADHLVATVAGWAVEDAVQAEASQQVAEARAGGWL